jgi:uncharacterized protein YndB with AHSA1/START domain
MTADRELVLTRVIDATPDKVYRAWSEPELLKQWFAPTPFTTPVAELDMRAGRQPDRHARAGRDRDAQPGRLSGGGPV